MTPPPALEEARGGDPVALTRALVRVPSVNPDLEDGGDGEERVATLCAELLDEWGLATRTYEAAPGRPNVVAELAGDGPTLLLNGHLDTVGVEGMTIDPFGAEMREGRLWGRGACDMKSGVGALMAVAHRLARASERPQLVVALTADEENASLGMAELVRRGIEADFAVVCEPTGLTVMPAHKGFVWIRTRFQGRAAHGSRPDLGIDAIRHASRFMAGLDAHADALRSRPPHPLLGHASFHGGTIRGGSAASVYPEACELVLERRTLPGEDAASVSRGFEEALETLRSEDSHVTADLEVTLERPGTEVASSHPLVLGLVAALQASGLDGNIRGMSAWVDAAYLNQAGIPAVCFGPGSIEQAHTADEWVDVDQIRVCADVLERFALGLVPRRPEG
ncbi:MAG: ArgE/DapE family deacylase [Gemmatimonadota bacterium]